MSGTISTLTTHTSQKQMEQAQDGSVGCFRTHWPWEKTPPTTMKIYTPAAVPFIHWPPRGPDKLDLTLFSCNKFRSVFAKGARRSAPSAQNELKPALSSRYQTSADP
ncbi:hypothetical protein TNCV_4274241 [Trichonephila clavipes]|nr:hypothetical protein TNCV_4274241 [Trichonephila clavipes]